MGVCHFIIETSFAAMFSDVAVIANVANIFPLPFDIRSPKEGCGYDLSLFLPNILPLLSRLFCYEY